MEGDRSKKKISLVIHPKPKEQPMCKKENQCIGTYVRSSEDAVGPHVPLLFVQSSMRIAPPSVSSKTIGFDPSPSATDILATRFERSSPLERPASSALRLRLFGSELPLTCSPTVGVGARGFRGISGTFTKVIGFCSPVEDSGLFSCQ
ncbi:hypothetical protein BDV35DRAFT_313735 [Aspergillus flavus]|uniref:Uncharacterized protein n=1 Tax=Aspergillus flavus TaxID=5059 RepID=A0A5N6GRJ1_ASPFL|nr:hypothetical protein BDV35DRAFT_313735 [Aspergillus flavus]